MNVFSVNEKFGDDGMSVYRDVSIRSFVQDKAAPDEEVLEYIRTGIEMKAKTIPGSETLPLSDWVLYPGGCVLWSEKAWNLMAPMLAPSAVCGIVKHDAYGTLHCIYMRPLKTLKIEDKKFILPDALPPGEVLDLFRPYRGLKLIHCSEAFKARWENSGLTGVEFTLSGDLAAP